MSYIYHADRGVSLSLRNLAYIYIYVYVYVQSGGSKQPVIMQCLYLEITALGNVESDIFVKLVGVPAKRSNLMGSLRVLDSECKKVAVTVEGPADDVRDYYNYMYLSDNIVGFVSKVKEDDIDRYTQTEAFHVENYEEEASEEDEHEDQGEETVEPDEEHGEGVEPVGLHAESDVRVIPETPEKEEKSESDASPEKDSQLTQSTAEEDIATQYLEAPMSPVFKGRWPQTRREPVVCQGTVDLFDSDEEESQSILRTNRRKRLCKK